MKINPMLNLYCVTLSLYFLNNINYSIWVSITYYALFVWKTIWYSRKIIG